MARLNVAAVKWRERIGRWKQSKLTVTEFCRREQVSQPSFFQWRKRLRDESAKAHEPPRFVELRPAAWPAMPSVQITFAQWSGLHSAGTDHGCRSRRND
jgi:hypothetical protein